MFFVPIEEAMSIDDILSTYGKGKGDGGANTTPTEPTEPSEPSEPSTTVKPAEPDKTSARPYDDKPDAPKITVDEAWIRKWYDIFRNKYFGDRLPESTDMTFKTNNSNRTWGTASFCGVLDWSTRRLRTDKLTNFCITISNYNASSEHTKQGTLLHEMIHVCDYYTHPEHFVKPDGSGYTKGRYNAHGPIFFMKEAARLKPEGWNIVQYVTDEEMGDSVSTEHNQRLLDNKISKAVAAVLVYKDGRRHITKTDTDGIKDIKKYILDGRMLYEGSLAYVDFYRAKAPWFAEMRSHRNGLRGWPVHSTAEMEDKMNKMQFGEMLERWDFDWACKRQYEIEGKRTFRV